MFSHSCHWSMFWIRKIPTQRATFGLPNNSNFPLFICCGPEFRTKLCGHHESAAPPPSRQGGRVSSVTRYFFAFYHITKYFLPIQTEYFPEQTRQVRRTYLPWACVNFVWLVSVWEEESKCAQECGWGAKVNFYKRLESTSLKTLKSKQSKKVLRRSPKYPGVVHTVLILLPFGFCFFSLNVSR